MKINQIEKKEQLSKTIIEIGAFDNNYFEQYKVDLPPDTKYESVDVKYEFLPSTEDKNSKIIPLDDESINEVVLSNVLSDMAQTTTIPQIQLYEFKKQILASHTGAFKDKEEEFNYIRSEIAYYQKIRTIEDVIRVLKKDGYMVIYENYRQFHPNAVSKVLKWLKDNPKLEFTEDIKEENRIQPIFNREQENGNFSRKFNKVYKIRKLVSSSSLHSPY